MPCKKAPPQPPIAYQQQDGVLVRKDTGEVVPVPEEEDYFRLVGVPWIAAERRTVAALRRVARGNA